MWSWLERMEQAMFYSFRIKELFLFLSLFLFVLNIFLIYPWIRCLSIAVLRKKLLNFWPGSHMCHWLAQKQQTNCVFLCGWMNVRKLVRICGESHINHLLFLSMDVSVSCLWHFILSLFFLILVHFMTLVEHGNLTCFNTNLFCLPLF